MTTTVSMKLAAGCMLVFVQLLSVSCNGQQEKQMALGKRPDVKYKVDKEYDRNGNLIRYDSSYSYSSQGAINDSLIRNFTETFSRRAFTRDLLPLQDSIPMLLFPPHEPGQDMFKRHQMMFEEMNREFERMHQRFQQYEPPVPSAPKQKDEGKSYQL